MSKFSSFKDQQLISESWRKYNNLTEEAEQVKPDTSGNSYKDSGNQEKPESELQKPEQKDLQAFQSRQAAMTTVNPQIIAQKIVDYLKTLRGFDVQKNSQMVIGAMQLITKQLSQPQKTETGQKLGTPEKTETGQKPNTQAPVKEAFHYNGKQFNSMQDVEEYRAEQEEAVVDTKGNLPWDYGHGEGENKIESAKEILRNAIQQLDSLNLAEAATLDDGTLVCEACLLEIIELSENVLLEAKYQGRTVTLNKPTKGDVKKFKVYVKDPSTGNIKKVNFGDPNMKIKKNIPARRKSFRARHNCANPGPKTKARYWSCKKW